MPSYGIVYASGCDSGSTTAVKRACVLTLHAVHAMLQDRTGPNRAKPMTATATAMVKAIWQSYFTVAQGGQAEEEGVEAAEGTAKEVEEVRGVGKPRVDLPHRL